MNRSDLAGLLSALQPFYEQGDLEEEMSDLTVHIDIASYEDAGIRTLLSQLYQHPRVINDCSVDVHLNGSNTHLFRITKRGIQLNETTFQRLGEETSVNGPDYESRLSSHSANSRESQLIDTVIELLTDIEENSGHSIDFPLLLDKNEIGVVILDDTTLEGLQPDDVHLHFWFDIGNLQAWLSDRSFSTYGSRFFPPDQIPILVYFQNSGNGIDGTTCFSVFQLTDDISLTQPAYQAYKERVSLTGENTTFHSGAPVVSPALFTDSPTLAELFQTAVVYAVFAVFSDRVTQQDGTFEFYTKHGPESLQTDVDIDAEASTLTLDQVTGLCRLYQDFAEREDRETFVGFWRRSAVQQCDAITALPTTIDDIRDHYRFIEAETVERNFDDLSDAVRDTHAFMTDITSQVADTTAALSDEIQRLVFTLLGAILANLFLILRWGNIDMVIPFSLFVAGAILIFYFPLIDRRIEELEEIKSKGEQDYQTYNDLITSFTGEAFDFGELTGRKDEYITYADQRLDWARRNLCRIHTTVLLTGFVFVSLATTRYPPQSTQIVLSGVYIAAIGYLTFHMWTSPEAYSYYQISSPFRDAEATSNPENNPYTNYLPHLTGIVSLILIGLNIGTSILPT